MPFKLPELPWPKDALSPYISAETIEYHYGKHHLAYVNNLNTLVNGTALESESLEMLFSKPEKLPADKKNAIFNNAAQVYNHTFYWKCLTPKAGNLSDGNLLELIKKNFGSFDSFKEKFSDTAVKLFGSGWAWLVKNADGSLAVEPTSNADNPLAHGKSPLLTCDVWEHAYYIDYRNARAEYVKSFWNCINWDFVQNQL
ncbi:MAG: superoxide dismutase [Candidatus Aureabacteria bacterium]|nr:superoxide dismutase [Candidatus Auribacterota bacterium]